MQNYLEALGIQTKDNLKKELDKTKWIVTNLEGLGLQDYDVYKQNKSKLNQMENVYSSLSDVSKVSEADARSLISRANSLLSGFISDTKARDQEVQESITNVAANTVAAMAGPATRAGISTATAAIPAQQVMSQAQQQRAQQASLTDQKIQQAAMEFLNMEANIGGANIANQINIKQLEAQQAALKPSSWAWTKQAPKQPSDSQSSTTTQEWSSISVPDSNTWFPKVAENDPNQVTALTWLSNQQKSWVNITEAYLKSLIASSKSVWDNWMAQAYTNILNSLKQQGQL